MTPADYAEALERAADLAESEGMDGSGWAEQRIDAQALRALAKALRNIDPFCEGGEVWLMSRGWDEVKLP